MDIKLLLQPIVRWWWLIFVAVLLAGASSYLVVRDEPPVYRSRATLMVGRAIDDPNPSGGELYLSQQLAQSYADIIGREPLREATMAALGMDWLPGYSARAVPNTQLLEIYVTDFVPERAQIVAAELANQLILRSPGGQLAAESGQSTFISDQLTQFESQILETEEEITAQQARLGELFSASEIDSSQQEIRGLEAKLRTIQSNYALLLANSQEGFSNALNLIEPASLPTRPLSSSKTQSILVAVAVSLVLSLGAAYVLEFIDDSVRSPESLSRITSLPTLGVIGKFDLDISTQSGKGLPALDTPRAPLVEAYRALRTGILLSSIDEVPRRILVTSPTTGDGKSSTAANLAVVMAQADRRVLLIDCDLRRPKLHKLFCVTNNNGLTDMFLALRTEQGETTVTNDYLANSQAIDEENERLASLIGGQKPMPNHVNPISASSNLPKAAKKHMVDNTQLKNLVERHTKPTKQPGLRLLTAGTLAPNPSELLGSETTKLLVQNLLCEFDLIIFDTPPVLAVTDAVALSANSDWVMIVVRAGKTRQSHLKRALALLSSVSAPIGGLIMNDYRPLPGSDYYYGYQYGAQPEAVTDLELTSPKTKHLSRVRRLIAGTRSLLQ